jgi:hypothetical protein
MERTGIEPVTSGLQSRARRETSDDGRRQAALGAALLLKFRAYVPYEH